MIDVNELRKGVTFELENELFKVLDYEHHKPGRGKATIRIKACNLRTGTILEKSFISGDRVKDVDLEYHKVQFLYTDGSHYHFMDLDTYEQPAISADIIGEATNYLKENLEALLADLQKAKPASAKGQYMKKVSVSTTMGPGIVVDQASLAV